MESLFTQPLSHHHTTNKLKRDEDSMAYQWQNTFEAFVEKHAA